MMYSHLQACTGFNIVCTIKSIRDINFKIWNDLIIEEELYVKSLRLFSSRSDPKSSNHHSQKLKSLVSSTRTVWLTEFNVWFNKIKRF